MYRREWAKQISTILKPQLLLSRPHKNPSWHLPRIQFLMLGDLMTGTFYKPWLLLSWSIDEPFYYYLRTWILMLPIVSGSYWQLGRVSSIISSSNVLTDSNPMLWDLTYGSCWMPWKPSSWLEDGMVRWGKFFKSWIANFV